MHTQIFARSLPLCTGNRFCFIARQHSNNIDDKRFVFGVIALALNEMMYEIENRRIQISFTIVNCYAKLPAA